MLYFNFYHTEEHSTKADLYVQAIKNV